MNDELRVEVTALVDFRYNGGMWAKGFTAFIPDEHANMLHDAGFVRFANPENAKPASVFGIVNINAHNGKLLSKNKNP